MNKPDKNKHTDTKNIVEVTRREGVGRRRYCGSEREREQKANLKIVRLLERNQSWNFSWLVLDAFCCSLLLYQSYQKTKVSLPIVLLKT